MTNTVDATVGQPMVARITVRKLELETLLGGLEAADIATRKEIEFALSGLALLMSGDLANVPAVVTVDMNRWLERTKHLGARAPVSTIIIG